MSASSSALPWWVVQLTGVGLAETEAVEVGGLLGEFGAVGLVGDEEDGLIFFAEELGDGLVEGDPAGLGIDDEEDELGLVGGELHLAFDVGGEVVAAPGIDDAVAAGVGELEGAATGFNERGDAVPRDAGGGVNDGDAAAGEEVEQAGLADVGAADDGDNGEHGGTRIKDAKG